MSEVLSFLLPPKFDLTELLAKTGEPYYVEDAEEKTISDTHYDTFDWRLSAVGLTLSLQGSRWRLAGTSGEEGFASGGSRRKKLFWWDLPDDDMREKLRPVVGQRALLPQFTLAGLRRRFNLLNSDRKTVLRLILLDLHGQADGQRFTPRPALLLEPLKGYSGPCRRLCRLLKEAGLDGIDGGYDLVAQVQAAMGIDPQTTSSKFAVELDPQATVAEAVRDICLRLRSIMVLNLSGLLADIDSEFLHDFRVSVRRTRSLLSLMKKKLPAEEVARFQAEFKWLGGVTGPVRDLDVYLLKESAYRELLPEELQKGLGGFFTELARRRRGELRRLRSALRSPRFAELLHGWEAFLLALPQREELLGRHLCREVTGRIIRKRLARLLRSGQAITPQSPVKELHALRIEGKKFRYLLEFFRSLYDLEAVDTYLKQMKKLQSVLGDFNDVSVQKNMLVRQLGRLRPEARQSIETAAALGGLIVHFHEHQRQARSHFAEMLAAFATVENAELMERILAETQSSAPT